MKIIDARNPVRKGADVIDVEVLFEELKTLSYLPFSASPRDAEAHGRELYTKAANGDFGPVR